jgi:hypothetical protein
MDCEMGWRGTVLRLWLPGLGVIGASDVGAATSSTLQVRCGSHSG